MCTFYFTLEILYIRNQHITMVCIVLTTEFPYENHSWFVVEKKRNIVILFYKCIIYARFIYKTNKYMKIRVYKHMIINFNRRKMYKNVKRLIFYN